MKIVDGVDSAATSYLDTATHRQILDLQEKFLTKGFHHISAKNVAEGRAIIYQFLHALRLYHDVACITVDKSPLKPSITDLYRELVTNDGQLNYLENYFTELFIFDFVWIEMAKDLVDNTVVKFLKHEMARFGLGQQIPIVTIAYTG